jgi:peptidoglycan/xylan/chitin deacetylase (PgdA/CDA1 family)
MGEIEASSASAAILSGVHSWLWTRDPRDWLPGRATQEILDDLRVLRAGDVVLLHDGLELPVSPEACDRSATVAAIPELIRRARETGLRLVTLPDSART